MLKYKKEITYRKDGTKKSEVREFTTDTPSVEEIARAIGILANAIISVRSLGVVPIPKLGLQTPKLPFRK